MLSIKLGIEQAKHNTFMHNIWKLMFSLVKTSIF